MRTFKIHVAKTLLSRLVNRAVRIGKSLVKDLALDAPVASQMKRLGFLAGQIRVPADFDRMGAAEVEQLFTGSS
ncbi:MAG: hypothetical protein CMLOHMNK_01674 [Steroidobacteraceae bacterium]|nr:hypothetical protein [Steroidobacteraceae bacterium]